MEPVSDEAVPDAVPGERSRRQPGAHVSQRWSRWRAEVDLDEYETRWEALAAGGANAHGEADFLLRFAPESVLDAGCGTGRVANELARRGVARVVGVDLDDDLLDLARPKNQLVRWLQADLATLALGEQFAVVALVGNVPIFCEPTARPRLAMACARHVAPGGVLVAGFSLNLRGPTLAEWDAWLGVAGFVLATRHASWDGEAYVGGDYAVSVHERGVSPLCGSADR